MFGKHLNYIVLSGYYLLASHLSYAQDFNLFFTKTQYVQRSVLFSRVQDGKDIISNNPDELLIPASVTKLITTAVALEKYSPHHMIRTPFYYTGNFQNGVISGDLIVVGQGDPFIISEKLWQLAADLRIKGLTHIKGHIVIDNSLFDDEYHDESRLSGLQSSSNAYDAPVSAFGVNFNTFALAVAPAHKLNSLAYVGFDPYPLEGVFIQNRVLTTNSGSSQAIKVQRLSPEKKNASLTLSGNIPPNSPVQKFYRSIKDPVLVAGEYLKSFLKAAGIQVSGKIISAKLPKGSTKPLIELQGYPMAKIVEGLNKYSNNYIADVLIKKLGADFAGDKNIVGQGTLKNGTEVLKKFLQNDVGIKSPFVLENGSGLNPDNRLSARQIVSLLRHMAVRFEVFPEFLASLPASGEDGTLEKRFNGSYTNQVKGQVRAKTGTLTSPVSVAGLAGYLYHDQHGLVAFAVIENGQEKKPQPSVFDLRQHQDQALVKFLAAKF